MHYHDFNVETQYGDYSRGGEIAVRFVEVAVCQDCGDREDGRQGTAYWSHASWDAMSDPDRVEYDGLPE